MSELYDDTMMRGLGFTDHVPENWYRCFSLLDGHTTLNLIMNKRTGNCTESVINESFGQHEYYGHMKPEYRDKFIEQIDTIIAEMSGHGFSFEVDHRHYGCEDSDE